MAIVSGETTSFQPSAGGDPGRCRQPALYAALVTMVFQPSAGGDPGRCWSSWATSAPTPGFNPRPGVTPAAAWNVLTDVQLTDVFQPSAGGDPGRCSHTMALAKLPHRFQPSAGGVTPAAAAWSMP